jgi:hypothetical protein
MRDNTAFDVDTCCFYTNYPQDDSYYDASESFSFSETDFFTSDATAPSAGSDATLWQQQPPLASYGGRYAVGRRTNSFFARRRILHRAQRDLLRLRQLLSLMQPNIPLILSLRIECQKHLGECADWYKTVCLPAMLEDENGCFTNLHDHLKKSIAQTKRFVSENQWALDQPVFMMMQPAQPQPCLEANESGESSSLLESVELPRRRQCASDTSSSSEEEEEEANITAARRYSAPPVMLKQRITTPDPWPVMPEQLEKLPAAAVVPNQHDNAVPVQRRVTYSGMVKKNFVYPLANAVCV